MLRTRISKYASCATFIVLTGLMGFVSFTKAADDGLPTAVLFSADFAADDIGALPEGWRPVNENGFAEVIADDQVEGGRALRLVSQRPPGETVAFQVRGPIWDEEYVDAKVVAVQFQVKRVYGGLFNVYVTSSDHGYHTQVHITSSGQMRARNGMDPLADIPVVLDENWNTVKLEINREAGELYLYVNNMETPVAGPLQLIRPLNAWRRVRLDFLIGGAQAEVRYANFKVWVVE